jgi:hypothetical protein
VFYIKGGTMTIYDKSFLDLDGPVDLHDRDEHDRDAGYLGEWDDTGAWSGVPEEEDDDADPEQYMARVAADIEAGRAGVPRGWKLDRPSRDVLVWTMPTGRRFACTLAGDPLPLP